MSKEYLIMNQPVIEEDTDEYYDTILAYYNLELIDIEE